MYNALLINVRDGETRSADVTLLLDYSNAEEHFSY